MLAPGTLTSHPSFRPLVLSPHSRLDSALLLTLYRGSCRALLCDKDDDEWSSEEPVKA